MSSFVPIAIQDDSIRSRATFDSMTRGASLAGRLGIKLYRKRHGVRPASSYAQEIHRWSARRHRLVGAAGKQEAPDADSLQAWSRARPHRHTVRSSRRWWPVSRRRPESDPCCRTTCLRRAGRSATPLRSGAWLSDSCSPVGHRTVLVHEASIAVRVTSRP